MHPGVRVEQFALGRMQDVLRDEAPTCDFPQAPALGQGGHGLGFDTGQAERDAAAASWSGSWR
jgi:hypothetical protein